MKEARVSELKAHLSAYLAEVRRGGTITVLDRHTPIARIVPFIEHEDRVQEPARGVALLRALRPVRLRRKVDVVRLFREGRDQR